MVQVLKKAPKLFPASPDDVGRWSKAVCDAWTALSWSLNQAQPECDAVLASRDDQQQRVDDLWSLWQGRLENVLLRASSAIRAASFRVRIVCFRLKVAGLSL